MIYVDIPKVRGKMAERGFTITSLAKELGINRNTLSDYIEDPKKMPYTIISAMANMLCNTHEEAAAIFFAEDLRATKVE